MDVPARRHDRGAVLSFADGHAEQWRWRTGSFVFQVPSRTLPIDNHFAAPGYDLSRIQAAASVKN
jgi:prepilin-type processing-associated H-X9-DG protein